MEEKENVVVENEEVKEVKKESKDFRPYIKYVVILIVLALVFVGGCQLGEKRMQDSAIRYGAGEYFADATGKTHFRFIKSKDEKVAEDESKVIIQTPAETSK